jgi:hypothetical protein
MPLPQLKNTEELAIAIENRCQTDVFRADFDPDTDSDFEFGWNPKVEPITFEP